MAREYKIVGSVMYRDGVEIAGVHDNELEYLPGMIRYAGPAQKFFRDWLALGDGCMREKEPDMRDTDCQFHKEPVEALRRRYPDYKGTIQA
jgi:hypothetical protein